MLAARDEHFAADVDIVSDGSVPRSVFLLKEGMAIRYRNLPDGGRQIMTFLIPGDLCDMHVFLLKAMDHSIGTITPVRVAPISRESLIDVFSHRPRISAALWWSSMSPASHPSSAHEVSRAVLAAESAAILLRPGAQPASEVHVPSWTGTVPSSKVYAALHHRGPISVFYRPCRTGAPQCNS